MSWEKDANPEISKTLEAVSEYFGLGAVQNQSRIGGEANKNYIVQTSAGEFIFKVILEHPLEDVETEIAYLKKIKEFNFPSSFYISPPTGSSIYQERDQMILALPKLDGHQPERAVDVCRTVGRQLAKLHQILTDGLPARNSWLGKQYLPKAVQTINEKLPSQAGRVNAVYEGLKDFPYDSLPKALVHGDMAPENCLFDGDKLIAFLDWEEVGVAPAILDLSICLLNFCFEENKLHPELFQTMLSGYREVRELTGDEIKYFPDALRFACLAQCVWRFLQFGVYHPDSKYIETAETYWEIGLDNLQLPAF